MDTSPASDIKNMSEPSPKIELHESVSEFIKEHGEALLRTELHFTIDHPYSQKGNWIWEKFREWIEKE